MNDGYHDMHCVGFDDFGRWLHLEQRADVEDKQGLETSVHTGIQSNPLIEHMRKNPRETSWKFRILTKTYNNLLETNNNSQHDQHPITTRQQRITTVKQQFPTLQSIVVLLGLLLEPEHESFHHAEYIVDIGGLAIVVVQCG